MQLRRVTIILLVVLLLGALVVPGAMAKKADKMVPLRGSFEGVENEFSGNLSHLGHFTGVFDPDTFVATWTAANGKTTVLAQTIGFVPHPDGTYTQQILIVGGTGKFKDATGSAEVTGNILDNDPFTYDGELIGEISQPNKKK